MSLINTKYFRSKDIKVFPSSFRGAYTLTSDTSATIIDPEARLNTEATFTLPRQMMGKDTYILEYNTNNYIKFVLGGYYFEISNLSDYLDDIKGKNIGIKLREITLKEDSIESTYVYDSERKTKLLDTWGTNTDHTLDINETIENKQVYYFTGLRVFLNSEATTEAGALIKLFNSDGSINQTMILPDIDHGAGINTLMHGQGLTADYSNQTVFGVYNSNQSDTLFEVGKGTSGTTENALEISTTTTTLNNNTIILNGADDNKIEITEEQIHLEGDTNIDGTTTIRGALGITRNAESNSVTTGAVVITGGIGVGKNLNVGTNANVGNKLIVKQTPATGETNVKVDGTLNITGETTVANNVTINSTKTTLSKPVEITDESIDALKVFGDVAIAKELRVGGNDTKVLEVKPTVEDDTKNVTITGTLETTDKATLASLNVNGATTINGTTTIKGVVNINQASTAQDVNINGDVVVKGEIAINGKATSTTTEDTDHEDTLTTKGYVKKQIENLDVSSVGGEGKYIRAISETDGKISATAVSLDTTISTTPDDKNTPTTKAVKTYVDNTIASLDVDQVGCAGEYIRSISETDGKITATAQSIDREITNASSTNNIPSSNAVWNAISERFIHSIRPIDEQANYFFYWNTLSIETPGVVKNKDGKSAGWHSFNIDNLINDGVTAGFFEGGHVYTIEHVVSALSVDHSIGIRDRLNGKEDGEEAEQMGRWGNASYVDISDDKKTLYILNVNPWDTINVKILLLLKRIY